MRGNSRRLRRQRSQSALNLLQRRNPRNAGCLQRERGHAVREVHGCVGIAMLVEVDEKGGGEDIPGSGWIDLGGGIGGKARGCAVLEERSPVPSVGCDQQGNAPAPVRQHGIGGGALIIRERQQIVVAENQRIEQGEKLLGVLPGSWPDASI